MTRRVRHSSPSKHRRHRRSHSRRRRRRRPCVVVTHPVTALLPRRRVSVWEFNASAGRATMDKRNGCSTRSFPLRKEHGSRSIGR